MTDIQASVIGTSYLFTYTRRHSMNGSTIDDALANTPLNAFHITIMCWCSMLMLFDGYDLVIYGSILPQLMIDWKLSPVAAGIIGSSALFGMMVGALTFGGSSDRLGRRRVILICLMLFGAAVLANGFCENAVQFTICRFLTGIGLGAMVPNVVALMSEMSPRNHRNVMVTIVLSFYSVGGVIAALIGKALTPALGWQANFLIAGLQLLAFPILLRALPESVSFLLARERYAEAGPILKRLAPSSQGSPESLASLTQAGSNRPAPIRSMELFTHGRAVDTLLLWTAMAMCMLMVYGLSTWLPKMMAANGYSIVSGLTFLITLNVGALLGGLLSGWLADRYGGKATLILFFAAAAVSIALLGYRQNAVMLNLLLMCAGATTIGTLCIESAFAAEQYPSNIRSTGVGWATAAGRLGAIAGPPIGGYLLSQNFSIRFSFLVFALAGVVAVMATMLISSRGGATAEHMGSLATPVK
jgi:MFS transporter, AAHS family, benzoate transport protein